MNVRMLSVAALLCAAYLVFGGLIHTSMTKTPENMIGEVGRGIGAMITGVGTSIGEMIWD